MTRESTLQGMVPDSLRPQSAKFLLDSFEVQADIGFHDYEIGSPQRLLVTVEIWLDHVPPPGTDEPASAWDYDVVRELVERVAKSRRFNLQETLAHAIYDRVASLHGVRALRVETVKPDTYRDARGVGFELRSFTGAEPVS